MADRDDDTPEDDGSGNGPILFLHARDTAAPEAPVLEALAAHGLPLYSQLDLEGVTRTAAGLDRIGALCTELAERAPRRALVLLRTSLAPSGEALRDLANLLERAPDPGVYTTFSNAHPDTNPWAGLDAGSIDRQTRERLVALLGAGRLFPLSRWPDHLLALTPGAVRELADPALRWAAAPGRLRQRLVAPELADWIYVEEKDRDPANGERLAPHEERRPAAWGALAERLQDWLAMLRDTASAAPALPSPGRAPVTLHVTHSWGGGVAAWVRSFIDGDPDGLHLQLRSEGPQTGQGAGQRLSLYLGNQLDAPLDRWWLQPPIRAVDTLHGPYREALEETCSRYGVGRIIVSSLVGHSLDALRMELPTVQVLHDAFPAWPLLSIHPGEFDGDLAAAMQDPRAREQFPDQSLEDWRRVAEVYAEAVRPIARVAPSRSARDVQGMVDARPAGREIDIVPHGLPPLERTDITPRDRPDGRLRIVVLGRVQSGKGATLLEQALPDLTRLAQVTLLGTGKGGERFFGRGGVNVVLQYDRQALSGLLADLGPHLALLPSLVPETFSYTLSELQALAVPVVATRLGSFEERIEDGETGWLVRPDAGSLVKRIEALARAPETLEAVRERLADRTPRGIAEMVTDYDALCPPARRPWARPAQTSARLGLAEIQAAARADELRGARGAIAAVEAENLALQGQVTERTRWAQAESRRREAVEKERDAGLAREDEQARELAARAAHNQALDARIQGLDARVRELAGRNAELESIRAQFEAVVASRSWTLTRPLRVGRRIAVNARNQQAWNPLRWPLLLSQAVRHLSTVGVGGTLRRMQHFDPDTAATPESGPATEPVEAPRAVVLPDAVPRSDAPRVSIVIPAFNHLAHTAACLDSLARARVDTPFEVIVVDDQSSDDTPDRLRGVAGLRLLRNEENQGFIRSCNRGAAEAEGDYVLFLNNDTQVGDGWLDALLETFVQRPDAGLVGARLVYPDGTLQECGGIVFRDGSGWNYGRGDDPERPEYQALREVDYCSGACIVLPRALYTDLGGFDERYVPAYYEDTDLAFRVREAGLKVYVQPRATVVHFEGVSSGTDIGSGTKRYQVVNRETFLERWRETLAGHPAPLEDPGDAAALRRARDHRLAGRVLVVDAYTPEPDQDSGSVRLVNLMQCLLDLGHGVSFFPDNRAWNGPYTRALQAIGVEAWYDPWMRSAESFLATHGRDFDQVIVSRHYVAGKLTATLRRHAPQAKFIFDTVDLHYLREQRLAELENSATLRQVAKQTRRSELAVIRAADATLVVSPVERELLAVEAPRARVFVLSNIHEVVERVPGFGERNDLYFVGGYQHPPNIDAARWFVEAIWPRVRERLPDVTFHLVGSKATEEVRRLGEAEGVEFHGFVESLAPFLDHCRLAVAPLRYGAGVKGKVNQAMAHGQPVVATSAAVEGLDAEHGRDVLVADDAEAFADAVVALYGDPDLWARLSENGQVNVREHFSRAAARRAIGDLFEALRD